MEFFKLVGSFLLQFFKQLIDFDEKNWQKMTSNDSRDFEAPRNY